MRYAFERSDSSHPRYKSVVTKVQVVQDYNLEGRVVSSGLLAFRDRQLKNNFYLYTEFNYLPARWDDINSDGNGSFRIKERVEGGVYIESDEAKPLALGTGLFYFGEELGGYTMEYELEATWRPNDRFSLAMNLRYEDKNDWLINWEGRDFVTADATLWRPKIESDFFLSARQQLRLTVQWAGMKAYEQARWQVPLGDGELVAYMPPAGVADRDFTISRLTFQARYRWEIAPLSDLFVVYTRGSDVDDQLGHNFPELLRDSWTQRLVDVFVIKLRYRLGS